MKRIIFLLAGGFILAVPATSNGQLLKKLKEKANNAVNKAIDGKTGNETQENTEFVILRLKAPVNRAATGL